MDIKSIIGKPQERQFQIDSIRSVNKEERTVEVAFSSEAMVPMWYGMESLSHDTGAADLSRMVDGGAVLLDHDESRWVGAVQTIRIDQDRKGRAVLKFGENSLARDVWPDIASGLRKLVSFRYNVLDAIPARTAEGAEYIKVTRWQPLEISFVSVPADASVGAGRSLTQSQLNNSMPETIQQDTGGQTATQQAPANKPQTPPTEQRSAQPPQQPAQEQPTQRDLSANVVITGGEQHRPSFSQDASEIRSLAMKHGALQEGLDYITQKRSVLEFKDFLLGRLEQNAQKKPEVLGLSRGEQKTYSFMRAMRAAVFPNDKKFQEEAVFELECSRAVQEKYGNNGENSISVPPEILFSADSYRAIMGQQGQRTFNLAAGPGAIDKGSRPGDFVELLRNSTLAYQLGARFIGDVTGTPYIPKLSSSAAAGWVGSEDADATTADAAVGETQITPKHVSATTKVTRSMLIQDSRGIESILVTDQLEKIAIAIDKAVFHGSGSSGQPTGLAAASIGSVAIGTNGGNLTYAKALEFQSDVETGNALNGSLAYVTTPGVKGLAMQTLKTTGIAGYIWNPENNILAGFPAYSTNQIASNLTKGSTSGSCHAMFFGNFSQMIVFGWGPMEFMRDPYTSSVKGAVHLTTFQSVDLFIRQLAAFSACLDLTIV